jgi:5-methylcytosine-specific restriction endonuclease McrA
MDEVLILKRLRELDAKYCKVAERGHARRLAEEAKERAEQLERSADSEFLAGYEWRKVRMEALLKYGPVCQCCGATPKTGARMNVDHIKPRKHFPLLALDIDNLQILCDDCNHGKGNWDSTDWRGRS